MKTVFFADEVSPVLDPSRYTAQRLVGVDDALGRRWAAPMASAADVRAVLSAKGSEGFFPEGRPPYPADDATLERMAAKSALEGVLVSERELFRLPEVGEALDRATRVFEAGNGAGVSTLHLLEALGPRAADGGFTTSDGGETGILGLVNVARAGHRVRVVSAGHAPSAEELRGAGCVYRPWLFDDPLPLGLAGAMDVVVADHTLVYTDPTASDRAQLFTARVRAALDALRPGGLLVLTQINDHAGVGAFGRQLGADMRRLLGRARHLQFGVVGATLRGLALGVPLRKALSPLQLPRRIVEPALRAFGPVQTHVLQRGLVLVHTLTRP